jgi:hypothetical protein
VASKELRDSVFLQSAHKLASLVLRRSREMGRYALGQKKTPYVASFHQEMSGIGYEFLRLASPASLPSLLLQRNEAGHSGTETIARSTTRGTPASDWKHCSLLYRKWKAKDDKEHERPAELIGESRLSRA